GDADALITTGWLPPDLANAVSRRAVALLELEDEPTGEQLPPTPTPFGPASGFGRDAPPFGSPPSYLTAADAPPYVVPATQPAAPPPALAPDRGRSALPYVAAIVVAGIAVIIAVLVTRGDDGNDRGDKANISASGTPTPTVQATTGTGPVTPPLLNATGKGALPNSYVGTWTGTTTTADGLVSQQITITLRPGDTGTVVADMKATALGLECTGESKLLGIAPDGLLLQDVPGSGSTRNFFCTEGGEYTLQPQSDGTLLFTSHSAGSGGLAGRLAKSA
ncbi:MAG TPA: hypothetical protein VLH10_28195, partial [Yinghuangia sp.]|nr:hypothetical protein [Yinghuangia sp.]